MDTEAILPILFLFIALFYSSVGFGGGSSYLAMLSIFLVDFHEIRSTALILNLCVVSISTTMFIRHQVFEWRSFWPFIALSIPMAFLGGQMRLSERIFFLILGGLLLLTGLFLIRKFLVTKSIKKDFGRWTSMGVGGVIGFLAGLSGIGGGIYLSPVLNMLGWKDSRKIAALSSTFILLNSAAGLLGLVSSEQLSVNPHLLIGLVVAVSLGGLFGSYLNNRKFDTRILGLLTAVLVVYVGVRLLMLHAAGVRI